MSTARLGARVRTLITPEGVALHLVLADAGDRLSAFLLDLGIICALLTGLTILAAALLRGTGLDFAAIIWILGFFLLRNFYFALFELRLGAATPGKRMLGIRVTARDGGRLTVDAILARNLLRELELFLPLNVLGHGGNAAWLVISGLGWTGLFTLMPLFNRDRLRIGDLVAGTLVVRVPRQRLLADLAVSPDIIRFTATQLGAYGIKELQVLESVLHARDLATMHAVAARIAAKIGFVRGPEEDFAFLQAYYTALRARLERGLLFGQRQRDKSDPIRTLPPVRPPTRRA